MQLSPNLKTIVFTDNGPFHIENNGQDILYTDFWKSTIANKSLYFLSCHEMCFRLLIPSSRTSDIRDIITGEEVLVTYGIWQFQESIEILFEDHTDTPYRLYIPGFMSDFTPSASQRDRKGQPHKWLFKAYSENGLIHEAPARLRFKKNLPYRKKWQD